MKPVFGDRGCIGVIDLSTCTSLTAEFQLALPEGVVAVYSRLRLPRGEVSVDALNEMVRSSRVEESGLELSDAGAAAVIFACTTGSLLHGPGFDVALAQRIERATGVRSTTTSTAVVNALHTLDATRICIGTPYVDELDRRERQVVERAGFGVPGIRWWQGRR